MPSCATAAAACDIDEPRLETMRAGDALARLSFPEASALLLAAVARNGLALHVALALMRSRTFNCDDAAQWRALADALYLTARAPSVAEIQRAARSADALVAVAPAVLARDAATRNATALAAVRAAFGRDVVAVAYARYCEADLQELGNVPEKDVNAVSQLCWLHLLLGFANSNQRDEHQEACLALCERAGVPRGRVRCIMHHIVR